MLTLSSAAVSGGTLTLEGTLSGDCYPEGTYYDCTPSGLSSTFPWSLQASAVSRVVTPVSQLAGNWTTTFGSPLSINADGSFTLDDNGAAAPQFATSGCVYAGQITLKDPSVAVYSVTASVLCNGTTTSAVGVMTLQPNGSLFGGLANSSVFTVLDTQ